MSSQEIQGIVAAVESEAAAGGGVIDAARVGEICLERLQELDRGAYLQFAGTLPDFNPEIGTSGRRGFRPGVTRAWIVHLQSQSEERFG